MKNPLLINVKVVSEECSTKEFVLYLLNELQVSTTKQLYNYFVFDRQLSFARFKNLLVELQKEQLVQCVSTYKGTREKAYFLSKKGRRFIQSRYSLPDVTPLIVLQKILLLNDVLLQVIHWCFNRKVPILSLITETQASADTFFEESEEPRGIDARLLIEWEGEEYFFTFQVFLQWLDFSEGYDRLRLLQDSLLFGYPERKNVEYGEYGYNQQLLAYPNSCAVVLGKNDGLVEQLKNYLMELNIERRGIIDYFLIENYQAFLDSFYEKLLSSSEN